MSKMFNYEINCAIEYMRKLTGIDVQIKFVEDSSIKQACASYPWRETPIVVINPKKFLMIEPEERPALIIHEIAECYSQNKDFYNKYPILAQLIWNNRVNRKAIAHYFGEMVENEFRKENSMKKCKFFKIPKKIRESLEEVLDEIKERRDCSPENEFQIFLFK